MSILADILVQAAPSWATIKVIDEMRLRASVTPPLLSGAPGDQFDLVIDTGVSEVAVSEEVVGKRLPQACPERHINYGGSFCLGYRRAAVASRQQAEAFWQTLRGYLLAQQFAERHGRWPAGRGLSHGIEAADNQIKAELAAARCDLSSEYTAALDHRVGWLAGQLPEIYTAESCDPSGAAQLCKGSRLGLVRDCFKCNALAELVYYERARRAADAVFVQMARALIPCCMTMLHCPLRTDVPKSGEERR